MGILILRRLAISFFFGSGGANDVSVKAKEVVVTVLQDLWRLVEKVPYVFLGKLKGEVA